MCHLFFSAGIAGRYSNKTHSENKLTEDVEIEKLLNEQWDFIPVFFFQMIGTNIILTTYQKNHLPNYQPLHEHHGGLHRGCL